MHSPSEDIAAINKTLWRFLQAPGSTRIAVCVLEREHPWQVGQFYKTTSIYLN